MSKLFNSDAIEEIRQETEWKEKIHRSGKEPEKVSETLSGLPVESINTPAHTADIDYLRDLGFPGQNRTSGVFIRPCIGGGHRR